MTNIYYHLCYTRSDFDLCLNLDEDICKVIACATSDLISLHAVCSRKPRFPAAQASSQYDIDLNIREEIYSDLCY